MNLMHSLISTWRSEALRTKHASAKATLSMLTRSCRPLRISLLRRLIPLASDQEIQPKECCCRCTGSDNNYTFRVERIQWQIDEPICAHDEQSQGADQVDRSSHWYLRHSLPCQRMLRNRFAVPPLSLKTVSITRSYRLTFAPFHQRTQ